MKKATLPYQSNAAKFRVTYYAVLNTALKLGNTLAVTQKPSKYMAVKPVKLGK